ncbi:MAG TPA: hypothetical protein VK789_25625 [Bryobacteraceae bacterium]|nr:hypothetical protein [Bryobacteraceae bacterium]
MSNFRRLLAIFRSRFLENDTEGSFDVNIYQAIGAIATPGFFVAMFLMPVFNELSVQSPGPQIDWTVRMYRLFFPAYSFAVTGFATVFEWDVLFPDRRDFLILAPFPIRLRTLFGAKFAALCIFLLTLIGAVNLFPTIMLPVFSSAVPKLRAIGLLRLTGTQIAATFGASAFAFFAVAAFQGVLIALTSPSMFRRISPAIQMFGMSLMVISLLTFPIYMMLLRSTFETHPGLLYFIPPVWFTGLYDLFLPGGDPGFARYGIFAIEALGAAIGVFALAWGLGFQRHYRRTLESEDTSSRVPSVSLAGRMIRSPEERAIFDFSGRILARSTKHRLFLATYLAVGISVGLLVTLVVRAGKVGVSEDGLRSFPFLIAFFVVSGYRAALQFPAELASNWVFRMTESAWTEVSRSATRKRVLVGGLVPALVLILPFEVVVWGWRPGAMHILCQFAGGALLIELLFWTFRKVPFTCSYFPGKINLALLTAIYLYGFTNYAFQMADLEFAIDRNVKVAIWFFAISAILLALCWRRHPAAAAVRFDASEPHFQTLDLT